MCIFSGKVDAVAGTCILVSRETNRVKITYSNNVACRTGNIMVLPINGRDVELIMLPKKYEHIGKSIADGYEQMCGPSASWDNTDSSSTWSIAPVIKYGPYDVSIVADLTTVDWEHYGGLTHKDEFYGTMRSRYENNTFIIAKIREANEFAKIPICYTYISQSETIQLPTFHIHDGRPEGRPDWDHYIFVKNGAIEHQTQSTNMQLPAPLLARYFNMVADYFGANESDTFSFVRIERFAAVPNIDYKCAISMPAPEAAPSFVSNLISFFFGSKK